MAPDNIITGQVLSIEVSVQYLFTTNPNKPRECARRPRAHNYHYDGRASRSLAHSLAVAAGRSKLEKERRINEKKKNR